MKILYFSKINKEFSFTIKQKQKIKKVQKQKNLIN